MINILMLEEGELLDFFKLDVDLQSERPAMSIPPKTYIIKLFTVILFAFIAV